MISTIRGAYRSSVGRLLERTGALVSAVVDTPLERKREVTVFLPENAYAAEISNCVAYEERFKIELVLIQFQAAEPTNQFSAHDFLRCPLRINGGYAEATDNRS